MYLAEIPKRENGTSFIMLMLRDFSVFYYLLDYEQVIGYLENATSY